MEIEQLYYNVTVHPIVEISCYLYAIIQDEDCVNKERRDCIKCVANIMYEKKRIAERFA